MFLAQQLQPEPWYELPVVSAAGWLFVILFGFWLFLSDKIITAKRHDAIVSAIVSDKDKQIHWFQQASEMNGARADLATNNMEKLLVTTKTTNALIRSLPGVSERHIS